MGSIETPWTSPSSSVFTASLARPCADINKRQKMEEGKHRPPPSSPAGSSLMDELGWTRPFSGAGSAAGWLIGNMSNAPLFHSVGSSMPRGTWIGK